MNVIDELISLDDNRMLVKFLEICDEGLYEMFTIDMNNDVLRLRSYLEKCIFMYDEEDYLKNKGV